MRVELPSLERYRGIRFVDTPGLESVLEHNTDTSLEWLPNVGLALVAVGVDPPLSQHDIELIRNLSRYTPNISLLLTKVDVLNESERVQVREFVQKQLARYWNDAVPVFPYSVRPGFEHLRAELDDSLLSQVRADAGEQRAAILLHKLDSLLTECAGYLNVVLKAAEVADSEREELRPDELRVRKKLQESLDHEFPSWTRSLRVVTEKFDDWLRVVLASDGPGSTGTSSSNRYGESAGSFRNRCRTSVTGFQSGCWRHSVFRSGPRGDGIADGRP